MERILARDSTHPPHRRDNDPSDLESAYARLRRIACKMMRGERAGHTLVPTEVVNEAFVRLLESGRLEHDDSMVDLISRAAHVMTQVLVDHARYRGAVKRGGGKTRVNLVDLDDVEAAIDRPEFNWSALHQALEELSVHDPRRHRVVTLRFFGGLDNRRIGRELDLDERTVGRHWAAARLWLKKRLNEIDA
jgi:RNA polymerase sigma factor (TIGR02999 family)